MPVVLKIDPRRKVVYSTFYGRVTDAELMAHGKKIAGDPDFNPTYNEIVDFSGVSQAAVSEATLQSLAGNPSLYSDGSLHIIVAPERLVGAQTVRKFQPVMAARRPNLFVVQTQQEAYRLLDGK